MLRPQGDEVVGGQTKLCNEYLTDCTFAKYKVQYKSNACYFFLINYNYNYNVIYLCLYKVEVIFPQSLLYY
jgi:hypothetical protein